MGKLEFARGGTIFLDEIGDLSSAAQAKLMKVLEEGTFERLGETETIAATNHDLDEMVEAGTFRQDLAFLLQKIQLHLPSLRDRKDDIPQLATHFMQEMATHLNRDIPQLSSEAETALQNPRLARQCPRTRTQNSTRRRRMFRIHNPKRRHRVVRIR